MLIKTLISSGVVTEVHTTHDRSTIPEYLDSVSKRLCSSMLANILDLQPFLDDNQWGLSTSVQQTLFVLQASLLTPPTDTNLTQLTYDAFSSVISAARRLSCICRGANFQVSLLRTMHYPHLQLMGLQQFSLHDSFLDRNDPVWPRSSWGDNYDRLLKIKKPLDPLGVFECDRCVGSEVFGF
ncbi:hypothetical protein C8J56DRAFT_1056251 [Mycena floridula]|nr:hypothetical protein C8J56DRAFT_1056251 [Mycena floridula]